MSGGLRDAVASQLKGDTITTAGETARSIFPRQYQGGHEDLTVERFAGLTTAVDAPSAVADESPVGPLSEWVRQWGLHAELVLAIVAGTTAAFVGDRHPVLPLVVLAAWLLGNFHHGRAVTTPLGSQLKTVADSAVLPLAALAGAVGLLGISPAVIPPSIAALTAGAVTSASCRALRWRLQAPVRVIVVGDRSAIATAAARWAGTSRVRVVGGLAVEPDLADRAVPSDILGVPVRPGLSDARERVRRWAGDLVVVAPGPAMTPQEFRRLTWALEGTRATIGVTGVLESVAPHRITAGTLERSSIIEARPPRPSTVVRGIKDVSERGAAALLLILVSPILLALAAAVRLDSRGPAFFSQTRVGLRGREFQVLKLRTMVIDADAQKEALGEQNEFGDVLFKMRCDPRVTRIGRFLRRSSLDELPQLINVVRGEMSLVGPRPFLADETARMDEDTLRRLAVKPGITGLWQVSGRSDLDWAESARLDTYYADNWSIAGDVTIGLRTVKAVLFGKGAY